MRFSKLFPLRMHYLAITIIGLLIFCTLSVIILIAPSDRFDQFDQFDEFDQSEQPNNKRNSERRDCYQFVNHQNVKIFNDISNSDGPIKGKSIFFLMTTCSKNGVIMLSPSQACAIESAAFHNPNRAIFVLFASTVGAIHSRMMGPLYSYPNIYFRNINIELIAEGTPVEEFYQSRQLFDQKYWIEHTSDFLRLLVLYKYGGIFLDMDCIVQKNLNELPVNFLGKEAYNGNKIDDVNNAVLGFQDSVGHEILELFLIEFISNYKPDDWRYNGGQLLTRILENDVCHTVLAEMTQEKCRGLEVFPPNEFYPVNWDNWTYFTNARFTKLVLEAVQNSSIVHLYNHFWRHTIIRKSKFRRTAYEVIAYNNCPKVFNESGNQLVFLKF